MSFEIFSTLPSYSENNDMVNAMSSKIGQTLAPSSCPTFSSLTLTKNLNLENPNQNIVIGKGASITLAGNGSVIIGSNAANGATGSGMNVLIGKECGNYYNGNNSVSVGFQALRNIQTGSFNTALGSEALSCSVNLCAIGNNNIAVGHKALYLSILPVSISDNIAIGNYTLNSIINGGANLAIGTSSLSNLQTGSHNLSFGENAGSNLQTANHNLFFGSNAGKNAVTSINNLFFGSNAGMNLQHGDNNLIFGSNAGENLNGDYNFIAGSNTAINLTSSEHTIIIGYSAMMNTINGLNNTSVGNYSSINLYSGENNTFVGYEAGLTPVNSYAQNCTCIGKSSTITGESTNSLPFQYRTAIGAEATVSQNHSLVLGKISTASTQGTRVGIGVSSPSASLHVRGPAFGGGTLVQIEDQNGGSVLECQSSGIKMYNQNIPGYSPSFLNVYEEVDLTLKFTSPIFQLGIANTLGKITKIGRLVHLSITEFNTPLISASELQTMIKLHSFSALPVRFRPSKHFSFRGLITNGEHGLTSNLCTITSDGIIQFELVPAFFTDGFPTFATSGTLIVWSQSLTWSV